MSNLFNKPDNLVDVVRQILSGKPLEEKEQKIAAYDKKGKQVGLYKNMADAKRLKPGHTYKPHKEELDPVGKEDDDVDNDGDVDASDKYLKKRRKAISKALNEKEPKKKINASHCEEVELDEVGGSAFGGTIDKIQKVVDDKQAMKIDGVMVDTFTASLIMKIFNRVNKQNQDKMRKMKVTQLAKGAYKVAGMKEEVEIDLDIEEKTLDEAEHEDGDGEKMTDAQKKDMDGDGEKDTGEKKKKKKKDEKDEDEAEAKPDKVDTEPEKDDVKTMMSEREMTDKEKAKLDKLKKKYEGGEMHKSMKDQYGEKADAVFYGKLTKMAMGEAVNMNEDKGELEKISKELAGASKTHKGQSDRVKKIADKMDEAKDEEKDTNLVMQLRKAISLRGNKVTFADGKSVVVSDKDAQKFMGMFSKLKKPAEKEMLMKSAAKSHKHFKMALAGKVEKPKSSGLDLPKMKSEK